MNIQFATCERQRAARFIRSVYPSKDIPDGILEPLLGLVAADVLRVQDPMMHGQRIAVLPGTHFTEADRSRCAAVGAEMVAAIAALPEPARSAHAEEPEVGS